MPRRLGRAGRLRDVARIGVDRMGAAADAAGLGHPGVLRLENLDTDLRPPDAALRATVEAVGRDDANSYLPFLGHAGLRAAVARHVGRASGVAYDPETQCVVTAGGLSGCLAALLALVDPGDEVILTDPTYVGMLNRVRLAGGVPALARFEWTSRGWRLDLDALERAVTPRTTAMFLMSPSMPSGATLDADEWGAVAALCRERDLWLLYNASMERIVFDGATSIHPAGLPDMADRTITIGSASKELRMIGWRVGWVVGPPKAIADVKLVAISDVVVPVGIAQPGVAAALEAPDAGDDVARAVAEWERRRDVLLAELDGLPLRRPAGGWSALLDAAALGSTGREASDRLLRAGIAATSMERWGSSDAAGYLRLVFSNEPVERLHGVGDRVRRALA